MNEEVSGALLGPNGTANAPSTKTGFDYYGLSVSHEAAALVHSTTEPDVLRQALALAALSDRVIVGGGGCGSVSALLAHRIGNERVVTYEPNAELAALMASNIRVRMERLRIEPYALAADSGQRTFYGGDLACASGLSPSSGEALAYVQAVGINEAVSEHKASGLVLDIEGAEEEVISTLDLDPIVWLVAELHPPADCAAILHRLSRHYREVHVVATHGPYGFLLWTSRRTPLPPGETA